MNVGIKNNGSGVFQAVFSPPGAKCPRGTSFAWTVSDVTVAKATQDATGLGATVAGLAVGEITLTFAATLPNSSIIQNAISVQVTA